ncbi:MAG TPA: alpha/beta hydrolase [Bacillota bacterium]|nr:alpha/beta hydrolase [Bacillota bacterium]
MASVQSACIRFLLSRANLWNKPIAEIRESLKKVKPQGIPSGVSEEFAAINGVGCKVMIPAEGLNNKAILYFHGGGFCLGIYHPNREFAARMAKKCGVKVFMPNYRLAPENPFPAALEDAMAVYKGMLLEGYSAGNIVAAGDSSGCGLLLSALLALKKSGAEMPSAISLITPALDFAGKGESFLTKAKNDPFRLKDPLGVAKVYVGSNNPLSPDISPLYGDLAGLPPILIHGAEYDVFVSDAVRFEEAARQAGVDVRLKTWQKMWHIFHMQDTVVPEAKEALREMCAYMRAKID